MHLRQYFLTLPLLSALGLLACGSSDLKEKPSIFLQPQALDEHAVFVDRANDRAFMLNVTGSLSAEASRVKLPHGPLLSQRRLAHNELLVLSSGDPDSTDNVPSLAVLDANGLARTYPLSAPFDTIVQSPDGRYVVARFGQNSTGGQLLFNRNEIAIIDLNAAPAPTTNPVARTIRGFGDPPSSVVFSPPMLINGKERQLALIVFKQVVAILDLNHRERSEFTIELATSGASASTVDLAQVTFDPSEAKVYLRGAASPDIYVIQLAPRDTGGDTTKNDFVPSLNQLGGGADLKDMALYGEAANRRLLVAAGSAALVIDADSNRVTNVPLAAAGTSILVFDGLSPQVKTRETRALLYNLGSSEVVFLDLAQVEERKSRNAELLRVNPYQEVIPLKRAANDPSGSNLVMLRHQGSLGASILDLDLRTVSRLSAQVDLEGGTPDASLNRVWVAPRSQDKLGFVDLSDPNRIQPMEVRLDYPIADLLLFTQGANKRVLVTHPSPIGRATVLGAENIRDLEQAVTLEGYLLGE